MKSIFPLLSILLTVACASGKEYSYIGSTPAAPVIRSFLGVPISDSIDFIRWRLIIRDDRYEFRCNYGISEANTNGFVNKGRNIELTGKCRKEKNYYFFQNGTKTLKAAELNIDLLHLLNTDNSLLVGNGGWSYTLNSIKPSASDQVSVATTPTIIKDSISFQGRTPCAVPGVVAAGALCYKLKWHIVLYANKQITHSGTYKIFGTPWRAEGGKAGTWKTITGIKGRTIYQLNHENGHGFLYLLKLDEQILVFTDAQGKLLVGNEDFSYTLNRR